MSSSMNPPDPYGTGDQSSSGSNPSDGSTPPAYGSTPPPPSSYGSTPPAYGSTPPAYGTSQPPYAGDYSQAQYGQAAYGYPKNSLGIWSFVLGLVGILLSCGLFTGIPAIIVGNRAKAAVAQGQANNGGLATAGVVLGWIATVLSVLGIVFFVILIATGAFAEFASTGTTTDSF